MKINMELVNVTVELLTAQGRRPEASLARLDFNKSRLMYESYSDGSKDIDLVSHEIMAHDTRFRGEGCGWSRRSDSPFILLSEENYLVPVWGVSRLAPEARTQL